jgi:hypothetical protein
LGLIYETEENLVTNLAFRLIWILTRDLPFVMLPLIRTELFERHEVIMGQVEVLIDLTETSVRLKPFSNSIIFCIEPRVFNAPHTFLRF